MPVLDIFLDGYGCWPDLFDGDGDPVLLMGPDAPPIGLALLRKGTESGKPTVTIRLELPDGRTLLTETTLALLATAVDAMRANLEAFP